LDFLDKRALPLLKWKEIFAKDSHTILKLENPHSG
jgi:hypothetical protein